MFIDVRGEAPALRRASILLERLREDSGAMDRDIAALEAGICAMRRAVLAGQLVHSSAIERLGALLDRVAPAAADDPADLLRFDAIVETRELLRRLSAPQARRRVSSESVSEMRFR